MAIPFPTAPIVLGGRFTPASQFRVATPPTNIVYFDTVTLLPHVATVTSNDGKTLTINSEGKSIAMNIAGDGTCMVPVEVLQSP